MLPIKVTIIIPPEPILDEPYSNQPFGIVRVYSLMKEIVEEVNLLDLRGEKDIKNIKLERADVFMFTAVSMEIGGVNQLAKIIKENFNSLIILGGPHINSLHKSTVWLESDIIKNHPDIDIFAIGQYMDKESLKEMFYVYDYVKDSPLFYKSKCKSFNVEDLDYSCLEKYASSNASIIRKENLSLIAQNTITGLGCAFNCSFCANPLRTIQRGSPKLVINHLQLMVDKYGIEAFKLSDDDILQNRKWIEEFLIELKKSNLKTNYLISTRPDFINKSWKMGVLEEFRDLGLIKVGIGVESADNRVLLNVNKLIDINEIKLSILCLHSIRLDALLYTIFGLMPFDKLAINNNIEFIDWCKNMNVESVNMTQLVPLPGCDIYDRYSEGCGYKNNVRYPYNDISWEKFCFVGNHFNKHIHCLPDNVTEEEYIEYRLKTTDKLKACGFMRTEMQKDENLK